MFPWILAQGRGSRAHGAHSPGQRASYFWHVDAFGITRASAARSGSSSAHAYLRDFPCPPPGVTPIRVAEVIACRFCTTVSLRGAGCINTS